MMKIIPAELEAGRMKTTLKRYKLSTGLYKLYYN